MTLDEAIKNAEEVAENIEKNGIFKHPDNLRDCAEEHRQLAEWLKELKQTRQAIEDIKEKIAKCKSAWEAEEWDYYTAGRSEAYRDALIIIDEHIGKEQSE